MSNTIQSLWIGDRLSTMEQMSILSYLQQGHEFHLYVYHPVADIPAGTTVRDANEIVPESPELLRLVPLEHAFQERWLVGGPRHHLSASPRYTVGLRVLGRGLRRG